MLLPAQVFPCCPGDPGKHLGHFAGAFALGIEPELASSFHYLPFVWSFSQSAGGLCSVPRGPVVQLCSPASPVTHKLSHLPGTILFNTRWSVGKPHGSRLLIKKRTIKPWFFLNARGWRNALYLFLRVMLKTNKQKKRPHMAHIA